MADLFISYSRNDIAFAKILHQALVENGFEIWIDWEDIPPSTDWMSEIQSSIEQADAFIFILSNKSINSEICSLEVTFAHENNKRLIPIVIDDIDPSNVPEFVAALNWIFFRESDDFNTSLERLLVAVRTDYEWVKAHTRYQNKALDWERNHKATAFLLRGSDIQEAETWLTQAVEKEPSATDLQRDYVITSRNATTRRQRLLIGAIGIGLIVALALSAFAFLQREVAIEQRDLQATAEAKAINEAQSRATAEAIAIAERDVRSTAQAETQIQHDIALSQYLAAESSNLSSDQLDLKLLLSIAASHFHSGAEATGSLLKGLLAEPFFSGIVMQDPEFIIQSIALSQDGKWMAVGSEQGEIRILDAQSGKLLHALKQGNEDESILHLVFSGDGSKLVSVNSVEKTILWDLSSGSPQFRSISDFPDWENFLAINFDGSEVAALSTGGDVAIWATNSGEILQRLDRSNRFDQPMLFSPDGEKLAAFEEDNSIHVWIREDGSRFSHYVSLPEKHSEAVDRPPLNEQYTLAIHPHGEGLLYGTGHATSYWNFEEESISSSDASYAIGFDSDGRPNALSISDSLPYQWDVLSEDTTGGPLEISFGGDPSTDKFLGYLWNPLTQQCFTIWATLSGGTLILRYSMNSWTPINYQILDSQNFKSIVHVPYSDGNLLIAAGCANRVGDQDCSQGLIQFWGGENWDPIGEPILAHKDWISSIAISADGSHFATASEDGTVLIWDVETHSPLGDPIVLDYIGIDARLNFHPSGEWIALYDGWDRIYILDVDQQGSPMEPFNTAFIGDAETPRYFAFSPDGDQMAVIHLGNLTEGEVDLTSEVNELYYDYLDYTLSPEGKYLITTYQKVILAMWDITEMDDPELLFHVVLKDSENMDASNRGWGAVKDFYPLAYHPTGTKLAIGMFGAAMLMDAKTGEILFSPSENLILHEETSHLAYSSDGQWIAAANTAKMIQLMDGSNGTEIGPPVSGPGYLQDALTFSPDDDHLFVVYHDNAIEVLDVDISYWLELACNMVHRELSQDEWISYIGETEQKTICLQEP
jgi:WD40 repeat protein